MMEKKTPLLAIVGPTASGKTGLAIALAKRLDGEIVSADSMQIYRGMDIGTAKPTETEMDGTPHHMLNILNPGERFSVARYVELAKECVAAIIGRGRLPILCGGTGLYIDSLTRNIQFAQIPDNFPLREQLAALAREKGNDHVWEMLQACDPVLADKLHPNNLGRVIRGIEVYRTTGTALSEWQRRSRLAPPEYDLCMLGLHWSRRILYQRINRRVEQMLDQGLLQEAQRLYDEGLSPTAAQAIGYKELFPYFSGEISIETAVENIQRETRRYAKRQMTWLRRDARIHWLTATENQRAEDMAEQAIGQIAWLAERGKV